MFESLESCLKTLRVTSRRLQHLASLPTATPESAGLCALNPAPIVSLSLKTVIGFGSPEFWRIATFCGRFFRSQLYGGHAQGPFGGAGSSTPVYQPVYGRHPSFGSESDGST